MDIKHFHRRRLPHLYYNEGIYFVTYRLYGSVPQNRLDELQKEINSADDEEQKRVFKKYDKLLDSPCNNIFHLKNPKIAEACKTKFPHPKYEKRFKESTFRKLFFFIKVCGFLRVGK